MDSFEKEASRLINSTYVKQGLQALKHRKNILQNFLIHKKLPPYGLDDPSIEFFISELAAMDSNNFPSNAGVGEREGRVYSSLVARRHYNLSHGIGRSGDIAEVQPKAAGSSIIYKLTMNLVAHALQISGFSSALTRELPLVLPLATGMSLSMCLLTLKKQRPAAEYVIWPRIDQKSCFKCILTVGLKPLIVENKILPDGSMQTDIAAIRALMERHGAASILCVLSTTSCFAPRQPDLVDEIGQLCKAFDVGHVVNNAYGLQCPLIVKLLNRAATVGRLDAIVQSTDKNFMVPVGGAIVISPSAAFLKDLSGIYPGRASIAPVMDLFITLLAMGEGGLRELLNSRMRLLDYFKSSLSSFVALVGEEIIPSPRNTISIGISLRNLDALRTEEPSLRDRDEQGGVKTPLKSDKNICTFFGSMLFQRCVSGCRAVAQSDKVTNIGGHQFIGWGAHTANYPFSYFTAACSIGLKESEINLFMDRLVKVYGKISDRSRGLEWPHCK